MNDSDEYRLNNPIGEPTCRGMTAGSTRAARGQMETKWPRIRLEPDEFTEEDEARCAWEDLPDAEKMERIGWDDLSDTEQLECLLATATGRKMYEQAIEYFIMDRLDPGDG